MLVNIPAPWFAYGKITPIWPKKLDPNLLEVLKAISADVSVIFCGEEEGTTSGGGGGDCNGGAFPITSWDILRYVHGPTKLLILNITMKQHFGRSF